MRQFDTSIQVFGEHFVRMQQFRQVADYDPDFRLSRDKVRLLIDETEDAVGRLNAANLGQRRAFAIFVLFRHRT